MISGAPRHRCARDLSWLGAIVLFGVILGPAVLMWGLTLTSASTGAPLLNTEGLVTMAIAWVGENVDRRIFLGAMAILAGAIVLSWPEAVATGPQLSWGSVPIVLACVSGDRQQSRPQAQRRRSAADRHDPRPGQITRTRVRRPRYSILMPATDAPEKLC